MKVTHVRVKGRVQGVFFRDFTRNEAEKLHLTGWVRNRRDGSVEAVISGDNSDVSLLLERLRQGPPGSRVDNIEVSDRESDEEFATFEVRY